MNVSLTQGQNSSIYFNGDFYEVVTLSGYRLLTRDETSYVKLLFPECSNTELGKALETALEKSRIIDPDNDDLLNREMVAIRYKRWVADKMDIFNYKTKRALFKKMHLCNIRKINGSITIEPMLHEKIETWSGDGISESDYVVIPDSSSSEEIGAAIRLAFSRCRSRV